MILSLFARNLLINGAFFQTWDSFEELLEDFAEVFLFVLEHCRHIWRHSTDHGRHSWKRWVLLTTQANLEHLIPYFCHPEACRGRGSSCSCRQHARSHNRLRARGWSLQPPRNPPLRAALCPDRGSPGRRSNRPHERLFRRGKCQRRRESGPCYETKFRGSCDKTLPKFKFQVQHWEKASTFP